MRIAEAALTFLLLLQQRHFFSIFPSRRLVALCRTLRGAAFDLHIAHTPQSWMVQLNFSIRPIKLSRMGFCRDLFSQNQNTTVIPRQTGLYLLAWHFCLLWNSRSPCTPTLLFFDQHSGGKLTFRPANLCRSGSSPLSPAARPLLLLLPTSAWCWSWCDFTDLPLN